MILIVLYETDNIFSLLGIDVIIPICLLVLSCGFRLCFSCDSICPFALENLSSTHWDGMPCGSLPKEAWCGNKQPDIY
ncbi:hypothetical protein BS47DRAFT_893446 [Hydnum rufescens UP504]|uniref:Uncharacterized protein n=1 Tax=Hydnum rufescens UP504 TaxID=1448309 RepID=A0A9P6AYV6_9AGAM|nr:hypothetical protein BS47DRAFT_893446 [Hydnum rufescens UP504]